MTWFCVYLCKTEDTMNYACCKTVFIQKNPFTIHKLLQHVMVQKSNTKVHNSSAHPVKGRNPYYSANALYQSKLIGSVFFVILHSHLIKCNKKLLFGLGKCSFWLVSWQFFPSFFWRPQIHKLSQTPLSFHRLSRP